MDKRTQPALVGGLIVGLLSALPIISAGNLCCCMWVIGGGIVAAYMLQQNSMAPLTSGDGALVGLLAGIVGAFVYLIVSVPITFLIAPMERVFLQRIIENAGNMPPEFREYVGTYIGGGVRLTLGFVFMLIIGSIFSTLGGIIGAAIFKRSIPPGTVDVPSTAH